jgi:hypothetical protein
MHIVFAATLKESDGEHQERTYCHAINTFSENPNFGERWKNLAPPKLMAPIVFKFKIERWKFIHVIDLLKMGFKNLCSFVWNPKECQNVYVGDYNIENSFF